MNLILNFTCHFSCKPHLEMCAHATDPEAENSTIINSTIFSKNAFSLSFGIMVPSYFPMNKSFPNLQVWKIQCKVLCSLVHFRGWHVGMTEIRDVPWRFHQRFEILSFSVTEALVNCSHYWYWILWWGSHPLYQGQPLTWHGFTWNWQRGMLWTMTVFQDADPLALLKLLPDVL